MSRITIVLSCCLFAMPLRAQVTTIQFESGSYQHDAVGWSWVEAGFVLRAGVYASARRGWDEVGWPHDGRNSYVGNFPSGWSPLTFASANGNTFSAFTVDLAEYSSIFNQPKAVPFVGIKSDLSTVSVTFTTDGLIGGGTGVYNYDFQTFSFPPSFTDLISLNVNTELYSIDNIVVEIPEPGITALLVSGTVVAFAFAQRKPSTFGHSLCQTKREILE